MLCKDAHMKINFFRLYSLHFSVIISFITGFLTGFQGVEIIIVLTVMEKKRSEIFFIFVFFFLCGTYTSYRDFTFPETNKGSIKKVSDNSILLYRGWFYRVENTKSLKKNDIISWKHKDVERENKAYHLKDFEIKNPDYLRQRFIKFTEKQKMGPLATALLTGERRFGPSFRRPFSRTGTAHIIALSALHIGTVLLFFFFLTRIFRSFNLLSSVLVTYITFLLSAAGAIFYLWITGWSIPTVRAAIFIMLISGFRKSGVFLHPPFIYIISLILTLTFVPHSVKQYSFIMSAVAVGTVIYSWKKSPNSASIRIITTGIMVNTALIPILSNFNGYVTYAAPLANLILIPLMGITVTLAFVIQLTFFIFPQISPHFVEILQFLCDTAIVITKGLSQHSQGMLIPAVKPPDYINILFYVFLFLSMTGKKSMKILAIAIFVILIAFYLIPLKQNKEIKLIRAFPGTAYCVRTERGKGIVVETKRKHFPFSYVSRKLEALPDSLNYDLMECDITSVTNIILKKEIPLKVRKELKKHHRFKNADVNVKKPYPFEIKEEIPALKRTESF